MTAKEKIIRSVWENVVAKQDRKRIARQTPPQGLEAYCDIPYLAGGDPMHLLDVYRPEEEGRLPVMIDVHGGGWMYGTKLLNKNYCLALAKRGFVVFNINYRLLPDVRFNAQMQDVFAAFKWIRANCETYGGDRDNIFLTGDSAGGNLVTLASLINGNPDYASAFGVCQPDITFQAVGAVSPVIDLTSGVMKQMLPVLLGKNPQASPLYPFMKFENVYKGQQIPPFYVVTSNGDFVLQQANALQRVLHTYQAEHRFRNWSSVSGKSLPHVFSVLEPDQQESVAVIDEMVGYFRLFLKTTEHV